MYRNSKAYNELYLIENGIYVPENTELSDETLYKMAYSFKNSFGNNDVTFKSDFDKNHNIIDQARNLKSMISQYVATGKKLPEGFDDLKIQLDQLNNEYLYNINKQNSKFGGQSIRAVKPGEIKKPTVGDWLYDSTLAGMNSFNSALFKTLDFLLPTESVGEFLFGDEYQDLFSDLADFYSDSYEYYSGMANIDSLNLGDTAEKLTPLIESTVAALPHAVLAMMSGGASLASSGSSLGSIGKSTLSKVASDFAKNPSFWLSAMQTMGNEYETAINAGANEFVASSYAILSSLINAGVEVGGGIDKFAEKVKNGNGNLLLDWVISSASEGGEEFVQGVVSNSLAKVMYDPDIKTLSMTPGEKAIFNVPDSVEEVKAGAFVGGILGGGQVAIDTVARNISSVTNADISNIYNNQTLNEMLKNKELDRRTALAINNLGKRIGKSVVFADELYDAYGNKANAMLYGDLNVLAINRQSTDPLVVAAFHESVHYLKAADIDTYNSIVSDMKEYVLKDKEYRNSHAGIVKNIEEKSYSDYMSGDAQIDADFVEEEFTSSALSFLFSDTKNVKKFAQENFNGFQRVVDNVIHVFEKNISMYEGRDKSVRDMYEPIIDKLKAQKKSIIQRYDDGISGTVNDYAGVDKYSIKFDKYGKKYWMIESENDIFKDISNLKELRKAAYDYILHGEKGELVDEIIDGSPLTFIRTSAEEYVYGSAGNPLSRTNYRQKMRMAPSILDLIENANVSYHTNDHKNHKIARDGFENYRGIVRIDNVIFNYIVRVGNTDSKYTFYDINLEVESILPSTEVRQEYNKNDSTSEDIISNPDENVNTKASLPQGTIPESSKKQIDHILHRAGNIYGISDLSQDELSGVSLSQKDIDARLGREFAFDNDIRVQSQYRDRFNNSLHLSDSVIFRYGEGSDSVLISSELVKILQKIRDYFGKPVTINSAYRNKAYNKKIGGATYSQHIYGNAAENSKNYSFYGL